VGTTGTNVAGGSPGGGIAATGGAFTQQTGLGGALATFFTGTFLATGALACFT